MIFSSFEYSRISNSLDWDEDDEFRGYEDIEKGKVVIQIEMVSYI